MFSASVTRRKKSKLANKNESKQKKLCVFTIFSNKLTFLVQIWKCAFFFLEALSYMWVMKNLAMLKTIWNNIPDIRRIPLDHVTYVQKFLCQCNQKRRKIANKTCQKKKNDFSYFFSKNWHFWCKFRNLHIFFLSYWYLIVFIQFCQLSPHSDKV